MLLGAPIQAEGKLFDPGKMGSYFMSPDAVVEAQRVVGQVRMLAPNEEGLDLLEDLFERAGNERKGLYVTF